jgi:hypothetical protein
LGGFAGFSILAKYFSFLFLTALGLCPSAPGIVPALASASAGPYAAALLALAILAPHALEMLAHQEVLEYGTSRTLRVDAPSVERMMHFGIFLGTLVLYGAIPLIALCDATWRDNVRRCIAPREGFRNLIVRMVRNNHRLDCLSWLPLSSTVCCSHPSTRGSADFLSCKSGSAGTRAACRPCFHSDRRCLVGDRHSRNAVSPDLRARATCTAPISARGSPRGSSFNESRLGSSLSMWPSLCNRHRWSRDRSLSRIKAHWIILLRPAIGALGRPDPAT